MLLELLEGLARSVHMFRGLESPHSPEYPNKQDLYSEKQDVGGRQLGRQ